ncbi:DUF6263 family protein [Wenyingzhuangia sp. IMCC45533]
MKIKLSFLIVLVSLNVFSQKSLKLEIIMKPKTIYKTHLSTKAKSSITFIADSLLLEGFKSRGIQNPMIMDIEKVTPTIIKTSKRNKEKEIPAILEFGHITSSIIMNGKKDTKKSPLDSLRMIGKYINQKDFKIDSIVGGDLNETMKKTISSLMENLQQKISFPKKPIKIGESFEQNIPMTIPIQGMKPVQLKINTIYTLKNFNKKIALFDIKQKIEMDLSQKQVDVKAEGSGSGIVEYDRKHKFLTRYESKLPMKLNIKANDLIKMEIKSNTITKQTVLIE